MINIFNTMKDIVIITIVLVFSFLAYYGNYTELSILLLFIGTMLSYFSIKTYKLIY